MGEWRSGGGPEVAAFVSGRIQEGRRCAQLVGFVSIVVLYMCHSWGIVGSGVSHHSDARGGRTLYTKTETSFYSVIINVKSNIGIVQELSSDGWLIPNVMISCLNVHPLRLGGIRVPDPLELFRPRTILSL